MKYEEILSNIDKKIFKPVYLLHGEEPFFIDKIAQAFEQKFFADESQKDFDFQLLYGEDTSLDQITSLCMHYPVVSPMQLIIVKEFQDIKGGTNNRVKNEKKEKNGQNKENDRDNPLLAYLKKPSQQTVLVLCHKNGKIDKRSAFFKTIDQQGEFLDSEKIYENRLPEFVKKLVLQKNLKITSEVANLIASYIGSNLSRLESEFDKLSIVLPPKTEITKEIVETYIGISKEFNNFELANAVLQKQANKAYMILDFFAQEPSSGGAPLGNTLYYVFKQLLQFKYHPKKEYNKDEALKDIGVKYPSLDVYKRADALYSTQMVFAIIDLLHECDLKYKGVGDVKLSETEIIREFLVKIF